MKTRVNLNDLGYLVEELQPLINRRFIHLGSSQDNQTYYFRFFNHPKNNCLALQMGSLIYLTENEPSSAPNATKLFLFIKKKLVGSTLRSINIIPKNRIVKFHFEWKAKENVTSSVTTSKDNPRKENTYIVYIELFSGGNLVVTGGEDLIILSIWRPFNLSKPSKPSLESYAKKSNKPNNQSTGFPKASYEFQIGSIYPLSKYQTHDERLPSIERTEKAESAEPNKASQKKYVIFLKNSQPVGFEVLSSAAVEPKEGVDILYFSSYSKAIDGFVQRQLSDMQGRATQKVAADTQKKITWHKDDIEKKTSALEEKKAALKRDIDFLENNMVGIVGRIVGILNGGSNDAEFQYFPEEKKDGGLNYFSFIKINREPPSGFFVGILTCAENTINQEGDKFIERIYTGIQNPRLKGNISVLWKMEIKKEEYSKDTTSVKEVLLSSILETLEGKYKEYSSTREKLDHANILSSKIIKNVTKKEMKKKYKKDRDLSSKVKHDRKRFWFEKYHWCLTSGGKLMLAGKDLQQNLSLIDKYWGKQDLFFHSKSHGAPYVILKNGANSTTRERYEAAAFAVLWSSAYKEGILEPEAFSVGFGQVALAGKAGEYLQKGSVVVKGTKQIYKLNKEPGSSLKFGVGLLFIKGEANAGQKEPVFESINYQTSGKNKELGNSINKGGLIEGRESLIEEKTELAKKQETLIRDKEFLHEFQKKRDKRLVGKEKRVWEKVETEEDQLLLMSLMGVSAKRKNEESADERYQYLLKHGKGKRSQEERTEALKRRTGFEEGKISKINEEKFNYEYLNVLDRAYCLDKDYSSALLMCGPVDCFWEFEFYVRLDRSKEKKGKLFKELVEVFAKKIKNKDVKALLDRMDPNKEIGCLVEKMSVSKASKTS